MFLKCLPHHEREIFIFVYIIFTLLPLKSKQSSMVGTVTRNNQFYKIFLSYTKKDIGDIQRRRSPGRQKTERGGVQVTKTERREGEAQCNKRQKEEEEEEEEPRERKY